MFCIAVTARTGFRFRAARVSGITADCMTIDVAKCDDRNTTPCDTDPRLPPCLPRPFGLRPDTIHSNNRLKRWQAEAV